ncbi:unnamed protein product [Protopolystoma xenopodis]|uniref:Uncharacterized protein n=1 Tax=Protopolystoma xenopodis TaxID=117903 RepID=A0A448XCH4_9PLAT|nr:unnamed protein product [Protopolystoma xenopodis]
MLVSMTARRLPDHELVPPASPDKPIVAPSACLPSQSSCAVATASSPTPASYAQPGNVICLSEPDSTPNACHLSSSAGVTSSSLYGPGEASVSLETEVLCDSLLITCPYETISECTFSSQADQISIISGVDMELIARAGLSNSAAVIRGSCSCSTSKDSLDAGDLHQPSTSGCCTAEQMCPNRLGRIECHSRICLAACQGDSSCTNRRFAEILPEKLRLGLIRTVNRGFGLKSLVDVTEASELIEKYCSSDSLVAEYLGEVITIDEANQRILAALGPHAACNAVKKSGIVSPLFDTYLLRMLPSAKGQPIKR